jgi:hypothetical protein
MSYLAYSNYPNENENSSDNLIESKRELRRDNNKTFKKREGFGLKTNKAQKVIEKMHKLSDENDTEDEEAFYPPKSAAIERMQNQENNNNNNNNNNTESMVNLTNNDIMFRTLGKAPEANYAGSGGLDLNDYSNYGDEKTNQEYYKRVLPSYLNEQNTTKNINNKPYYNQVNYKINENSNDNILLQKMNYMITLLEDQQDERTNNVTEEVVLYSFLGIFIIFIADTFVRVGKYVR